jgi:DNA polymerase-3 subunit alpha
VGKEEGNKTVEYLEEAENMGIEILPPDVQNSDMFFSLTGTGSNTKIRFGLLAIKNVGEGAVEEILRARQAEPFLSLEDFCNRVDTRTVNRKVIESLVKAGAFDFCGSPVEKVRPQLIASLESLLEAASKFKEDQNIGQGSLFGESSTRSVQSVVTEQSSVAVCQWHEHELLSHEKEVLGFYLSGHPLAKFKDELRFYSTHSLADLSNPGSSHIRVAGFIENVRRLTSKQSKAAYARFRLEDLEGEIDCVAFPKVYATEMAEVIQLNAMVVVSGRLNSRPGDESAQQELIVDKIIPLEKARETLVKAIAIQVSTAGLEEPTIEQLKAILEKNVGPCSVRFILNTPAHGSFSLTPKLIIKILPEMLQELKGLLGQESWKLILKV